jgi:hypothetical protein
LLNDQTMTKNYLKITFRFLFCLLAALLVNTEFTAQTVQTFNYTGNVQTFTVPACVSQITVDLRGAAGGAGAYGAGGLGGRLYAVYPVTPGQVLNIYVGGTPYNGGGSSTTYGGAGGGASDIRIGGTALANRVLVAGGGGGGGYNCGSSNSNNGGAGGGTTGGTGYQCNFQTSYVGTGGTPSSGGSQLGSCMSPAANGSLGIGGTGYTYGGGGGGGYYGGGAACYGGGGGGSSFSGVATSVSHTQGFQSGNGQVILTYALTGTGISATATPSLMCTGSSATLTASSVVTYTWSAPISSNSESAVVTPTSTTSYTVSGTNSSGCTTSLVITVTVDMAVPTLTVVNTASATGGVCPGQAVTISASGARTYTFAGAQTISNGFPFIPTVASGYTITGENACGTSSAVTSVSVHPTPTIVAIASQPTICSGNTVTFSASGNTGTTQPTWQVSTGVPPTNNQPYFPNVTATYTVTGYNAFNCTATAVTGVTVVTTPLQPPIATPTRICIGSFGTITATGASNYSWAPTGTFVGSSAFSIAVNPTISTTYTITKWNANCINTQTIELFVNNLPVLSVQASPTVLCAGKPSTLQVGGAINYTWTSTPTGTYPSGPNANFIVVNPSVPTEYTFMVTAHDGTCVNTETLNILVHPNPTITIANTSTRICIFQCATFTLGGGTTYTWVTNPVTTPPTGSLATICPTTTTNYSISATNYTITAPNATLGCTSSREQVVQVDPLPVISTTITRPLVCIGGPSTLITVGSPGPVVYSWNTTATSSSILVNPQVSSCYVVTVTTLSTPSQCKDTRTLCVNVFSPTFAITPSTSICYGGSITLTVGAATSYTWINPPWIGNSVLVSPTVATVYSVAATSISNNVQCVSTNSVLISIYNQPTVTAVAERTTICKGDQVNLIADGGQTYEWRFFANNFLNSQIGTTITVSPVVATTYTIYGTDQYGCKDTTSMSVLVSACPGFVERAAGSGLHVYPNPSNGKFFVSSRGKVELVLFSALGQVIRSFELKEANNYKVEVADLSEGIYFLSGTDSNGDFTRKIVVSRQ